VIAAVFIAVVVVAAGVREVLARVDERRGSIAMAATLAVLAVFPERIGRAFDGSRAVVDGLVVTALCASPLAILYVRRRLRGAALVRRRTSGADLAVRAAQGVVVVLGAWCAWTTFLWDEDSAHFGVSSSIARGVLPPVHPLFPGEPFHYHFGYDVLVAVVRAATQLAPDVCCDLVTTLSLLTLVAVCADAGRALAGRVAPVAAALAVVVVPLGYGPGAMCFANGWSVPLACSAWFPSSWVDARTMPPTVISNFFQHPQGLGMSLALAALLVALAPGTHAYQNTGARYERVPVGRVAVAAVLVALTSQAQAVYFALACGALAVGVVVDALRVHLAIAARSTTPSTVAGANAIGSLALRLAIVAAAGAAGLVLGGVFAQQGALDALHFGAGYFARDDAPALLAHNALLFGLPLVALPIAIVRLRDDVVRTDADHAPTLRTSLVAAASVGFVVANVATYERSWDIVKFFAAGSFFGNLVAADLLAPWLASPSRNKNFAALAIVLVSIASATLWLVRHGPLNGIIAPAYTELPPDPVALALDAAHGADIGPRDRVLTTHDEIAQLGFLVVGHDWRKAERGLLVDRTRVDREHQRGHFALTRLDDAGLHELGVRFLFLEDRELAMLQPDARAALDDTAHARFERLSDVDVSGTAWRLYRVREVHE
jgi:hypothetical protein